MIRHILVAVDGSEPARKAARFGHDLAQQVNARLTLLFVLEPPQVVPIGPLDSFVLTGPTTISPEELSRVRKLLDQIAADLQNHQAEKVVELGRPADTIVDQATKLNADLIVVGARGMGAGKRLVLGSVSDRVVHHADRPVTVVH